VPKEFANPDSLDLIGPHSGSCELFVLTRLAESLPGKEANLASGEWIENQCQFVERYSRPSLECQTDQNFTWVVSVSDRLLTPLVKRVRRAVEPFGAIIFQQGNEHSSDTFARFLAPQSEEYLTVRFDSDDVLHPTFVENAKSCLQRDREVFSFMSGVVYDLDRQIAGFWPHPSNTFLFHRGAAGANVYGLGVHSRVESVYGRTMKIVSTSHPMWMKLTHSANGWGDTITDADQPLFGDFVQRNFISGTFPTEFRLRRDGLRIFGFLASRLRRYLRKPLR